MQLLSYALSSLVLATSLTAASPSNLSQNITACARAASQLSCSDTKNPVDPTSFGTCCYNGALKPGFKESGLVLATQFYDAKPSTGPNDSTTIHGAPGALALSLLHVPTDIVSPHCQDFGPTTAM